MRLLNGGLFLCAAEAPALTVCCSVGIDLISSCSVFLYENGKMPEHLRDAGRPPKAANKEKSARSNLQALLSVRLLPHAGRTG